MDMGHVDPLTVFAQRDLVEITAPQPYGAVEMAEIVRLMARRILVLERALRDAGVDLIEVIE